MRSLHVILCAVVTIICAVPLSANAQDVDTLRQKLETIRNQMGVPGMSIAVVKDGEVFLADGFGLSDVEAEAAMTADTVFGLHSATKSFTAAAMIRLDQEGVLDLDDKVRDHLPWFAVDDAYISANMTLRDALAHRTGLPRTGMIYQGSGYSTEEATRQLAMVGPQGTFRHSYSYQNMLYNMMDLIITNVTDKTWSDYITHQFLIPLGMQHSGAGRDAKIKGTRTKQYFYADYNYGALTEIPRHKHKPAHDVSAPAGGIVTTARDLVPWLIFLTGHDHKTANAPLDYEHFRLAFAPHVLFRSRYYGELTVDAAYQGYGLGWFVSDYRGANIVWHGGNGNGESSLVAVLPEQGVGVAVFANMEATPLTYAAAGLVLDHLTGADKDWFEAYARYLPKPDALAASYQEFVDARVPDTQPTLPLDAYAGTYHHELYGDITVKISNGRLTMHRDGRLAELSHWHYDTFAARHLGLAVGFDTVTFNIGADGRPWEIIHFDIDGFYRVDTDAHH